jgi:hypothetical protein
MKVLFILKYAGKTTLIIMAVLALGHIAKVSPNADGLVITAGVFYCFGSVVYQFRRKHKKVHKYQ